MGTKLILIALIVIMMPHISNNKIDMPFSWIAYNNSARTCQVNDNVEIKKENIKLSAKIETQTVLSSVAFKDRVLLIKKLNKNQNLVACYQADTLTKLWEYPIALILNYTPICYNGNLYYYSYDGNEIISLSITDGKKVASAGIEHSMNYNPFNADGSNVFCVSKTSLFSFDAATLKKNWECPIGKIIYCNYCIADNKIILYAQDKMFAINETNGQIIWERMVPYCDTQTEMMVYNGIIYKYYNDKICTYSLKNGSSLSSYEAKTFTSMSICNNKLIITMAYYGMECLSLDMSKKYWQRENIAAINDTLSPLIIGNKIFCVSYMGSNRVTNSVLIDGDRGEVIWNVEPYTRLITNPLHYANKSLVFYCNGFLYSYALTKK